MSEAERLMARIESLMTRLEGVLGVPAQELDWAQARAFRWQRGEGRRGVLRALPYVYAWKTSVASIDRNRRSIATRVSSWPGFRPIMPSSGARAGRVSLRW